MFEVGDRVQARKTSEQRDAPDDVAVSEFTVTGVRGTTVTGSPFGPIDTAQGWSVEVLGKSLAALKLPDTLSEITASLSTGFDVTLIGKADVWRNEDGARVPVDQIVSWVTS